MLSSEPDSSEEVYSFFHAIAEKRMTFYCFGITSGELEVWEEAQYLLDGLTIKYVHLETGTPAFYIQHCHGTWGSM